MRLLYQSLFEIKLCTAKEGGMAVSAVWRLAYLIAPFPLEPRRRPKNTGGASGSERRTVLLS